MIKSFSDYSLSTTNRLLTCSEAVFLKGDKGMVASECVCVCASYPVVQMERGTRAEWECVAVSAGVVAGD